MPISRKEFEDGNFTVLRGKAYEVLEFLKSNKEKAYLSKELAVEVKITQAGVAPILKRLMTEGLIEKKDPYFSLSKSDGKKVIKEESKKKPEQEEEVEPYEGEDAEPEPYIEPK